MPRPSAQSKSVSEEVSTTSLPGVGWLEHPQPQDLVITILADNLRHRRETVWSGGVVTLLEEFGYSAGGARVALARLARRNLISRIKSGRHVAYQITDHCERVLQEGDDCIFRLGEEHADLDTVTLLWHTLDEDQRLERGHLARRLRFLGFGSLQDATWVAAGDREIRVVQLVNELGIEDSCTVIVGHGSLQLGLKNILDRAWDLPTLGERYQVFADTFGTYATRRGRSGLSDAEAFRVRTQIMHNFRQFPLADPGLPHAMYQNGEARKKSIKLFHDAYQGLEKAAHRHFDAFTQR